MRDSVFASAGSLQSICVSPASTQPKENVVHTAVTSMCACGASTTQALQLKHDCEGSESQQNDLTPSAAVLVPSLLDFLSTKAHRDKAKIYRF